MMKSPIYPTKPSIKEKSYMLYLSYITIGLLGASLGAVLHLILGRWAQKEIWFWIEVGLSALFVVTLWRANGPSLLFARSATLAVLLIGAAGIDLRAGIIPNRLILWGLGVGVVLLIPEWMLFVAHLGAASVVTGSLLLLRWGNGCFLGQPGLGMGDVKLAAMTGLLLGWPTLWVYYLAAILGVTIGLIGLFSGHLSRRTRMPFAPMVAGAFALHWFFIASEMSL
jgi:leader peptidase (prepilin peptidase)/N-methyltransferase